MIELADRLRRFSSVAMRLFRLSSLLMLNLHRKRNVPRENQESLERIKAVVEARKVAA